MPSESARVTTAAESRFRINYSNSKPQAVKVVALDEHTRPLVDEIAKLPWSGAVFFNLAAFNRTATPLRAESASIQAWLRDVAGHIKNLFDEINTADLIVMVCRAGSDAQAARLIGEACVARNVTAIGLSHAAEHATLRFHAGDRHRTGICGGDADGPACVRYGARRSEVCA
jgi:hypothetical protein